MPISFWPLGEVITVEERRKCDGQYAVITREIEAILSDAGAENVDKDYYNLKTQSGI